MRRRAGKVERSRKVITTHRPAWSRPGARPLFARRVCFSLHSIRFSHRSSERSAVFYAKTILHRLAPPSPPFFSEITNESPGLTRPVCCTFASCAREYCLTSVPFSLASLCARITPMPHHSLPPDLILFSLVRARKHTTRRYLALFFRCSVLLYPFLILR